MKKNILASIILGMVLVVMLSQSAQANLLWPFGRCGDPGSIPFVCCNDDCMLGETVCDGSYQYQCGDYDYGWDVDSCYEFPPNPQYSAGVALCEFGCEGDLVGSIFVAGAPRTTDCHHQNPCEAAGFEECYEGHYRCDWDPARQQWFSMPCKKIKYGDVWCTHWDKTSLVYCDYGCATDGHCTEETCNKKQDCTNYAQLRCVGSGLEHCKFDADNCGYYSGIADVICEFGCIGGQCVNEEGEPEGLLCISERTACGSEMGLLPDWVYICADNGKAWNPLKECPVGCTSPGVCVDERINTTAILCNAGETRCGLIGGAWAERRCIYDPWKGQNIWGTASRCDAGCRNNKCVDFVTGGYEFWLSQEPKYDYVRGFAISETLGEMYIASGFVGGTSYEGTYPSASSGDVDCPSANAVPGWGYPSGTIRCRSVFDIPGYSEANCYGYYKPKSEQPDCYAEANYYDFSSTTPTSFEFIIELFGYQVPSEVYDASLNWSCWENWGGGVEVINFSVKLEANAWDFDGSSYTTAFSQNITYCIDKGAWCHPAGQGWFDWKGIDRTISWECDGDCDDYVNASGSVRINWTIDIACHGEANVSRYPRVGFETLDVDLNVGNASQNVSVDIYNLNGTWERSLESNLSGYEWMDGRYKDLYVDDEGYLFMSYPSQKNKSLASILKISTFDGSVIANRTLDISNVGEYAGLGITGYGDHIYLMTASDGIRILYESNLSDTGRYMCTVQSMTECSDILDREGALTMWDGNIIVLNNGVDDTFFEKYSTEGYYYSNASLPGTSDGKFYKGMDDFLDNYLYILKTTPRFKTSSEEDVNVSIHVFYDSTECETQCKEGGSRCSWTRNKVLDCYEVEEGCWQYYQPGMLDIILDEDNPNVEYCDVSGGEVCVERWVNHYVVKAQCESVDCVNPCVEGERKCFLGGYRICESRPIDLLGTMCYTWSSTLYQCKIGESCVNGYCARIDQCTEGDVNCYTDLTGVEYKVYCNNLTGVSIWNPYNKTLCELGCSVRNLTAGRHVVECYAADSMLRGLQGTASELDNWLFVQFFPPGTWWGYIFAIGIMMIFGSLMMVRGIHPNAIIFGEGTIVIVLTLLGFFPIYLILGAILLLGIIIYRKVSE